MLRSHRPRIGLAPWILMGCLTLWPAPAFPHDDPREEIAALTARLASDGGTAGDYLKRGELHRLRGDWELALADYDRASTLDPALADVEVGRSAVLLATGQPAQARAKLDRLLAREPDHLLALEQRARVQMALGHPRDAVRDLDRLIAKSPQPEPDHYFDRAQALAACGKSQLSRAVRGLDQGMMRLGPLVTLESLAIDLEQTRGRYDQALARLERMATQFTHRERILERRARILAAAGRADEARAAFAAALAEIESLPVQRRAQLATRDLESRLRETLQPSSVPASDPAAP